MQSDRAYGTAGPSTGLQRFLLGALGWGCVSGFYPVEHSYCSARSAFWCLFFAVTCRIVQMINIRRGFFPLSLSVKL